MTIEQVKQTLIRDKDERYEKTLERWKNRKKFKDEDDIPDIPIVLPQDYRDIIIPNIIRCGGIPKKKLIVDRTYIGSCRNASEAVWNGEDFTYLRTKFGTTYREHINHFEDDNGHDLFIPIKMKED